MAQPSERDTQAQIVPDEQAAAAFGRFVGLIARLRDPDGCPWDRKQTHASIARNLIEEAYEAVAAIEDGDAEELAEELGDVLLEVVLQAQIASDAGEFTINDVLAAIDAKLAELQAKAYDAYATLQSAVAATETAEGDAQVATDISMATAAEVHAAIVELVNSLQ